MDFSATDIAKIIKSCKTSGVVKLEIGDLKLEFQSRPDYQEINHHVPQDHDLEVTELPKDVIEEKLQDDPEYRELMKQDLLINDPLEYEKRMLQDES